MMKAGSPRVEKLCAKRRLPGGASHVDVLRRLASLAIFAAGLLAMTNPARAGDPVRGEMVYQSCMDCHSLDENDVGPKHGSVFGSKAGSVPDYRYSAALRASGIIWNEETLDKWLTLPQDLVPGSKMNFRLVNPQDRADVIAYLKQCCSLIDQSARSDPGQSSR